MRETMHASSPSLSLKTSLHPNRVKDDACIVSTQATFRVNKRNSTTINNYTNSTNDCLVKIRVIFFPGLTPIGH